MRFRVGAGGLLLAAVLLALLLVWPGEQRAYAGHACPDTGSPFGPFNLESYETSNWPVTYNQALELAGQNGLFPEIPNFALPGLESGPRSAGSAQPRTPYIPPTILKAIGWIESSMLQAAGSVLYGQVGPPLVSHDCGYGIMQVTTGMQNVSGVPNLDQAMIGGHYAFNIARGARILAEKWNHAPEWRPIVGNRDPTILENWYYALWAYNGFAFKNHPLNPSYSLTRLPYSCNLADSFGHDRSRYPYQELVFGCVSRPPVVAGSPVWGGIAVHMPELNNPLYATPLNVANWNPCSLNSNCSAMDMPTPNPWHSEANAVTIDRAQVIGAPTLSISSPSVSLSAKPGGQSAPATVTIGNAGTGLLSYRLTTTAPWLKLSRVQGVALGTDAGARASQFTVYADTAGLLPGTNTAQVVIESLYAGGAPASITVIVRTADGALMRGSDQKVYALQGSLKRWVPDTATLDTLGAASSIAPVPDDWLSGIETGKPLLSVLANGRLLWSAAGNTPVYVMEAGKKRQVLNPEVMSQCGYGGDGVANISLSSLNAIPNGPALAGIPCPKLTLPDGAIVQGSDGSRWLAHWGKRKLIGSDNFFSECGYRTGNIDQLADSYLAQTAVAPPVSGCTADGSVLGLPDGKILVMQGLLARYIPDPATFDANGYRWDQVIPVGSAQIAPGQPLLSVLADGNLLRPPGDIVPIYVMQGGQKRHILSPDAFTGCGYNWQAIRTVPASSLNTVPSGPPLAAGPCPQLSFASGTVLRDSLGEAWVMMGSKRKLVKDAQAFASCGYQTGNVNPMPDGVIAGFPVGQTVTDCKSESALLWTKDGKVWGVRSGYKRWVQNPASLEAYGYSWEALTPVPDTWLPTGAPFLDVAAMGRLVRPPGAIVPIYVMDGGAKRHITSLEAMTACGYTWDAVSVVSEATLASYPTAAPLAGAPCPRPAFPDKTLLAGSDGKVWVVQAGQRRWVTSPTLFTACGYAWPNLNFVPASVINALPQGQNLTAAPCP